MAHRKSKNIDFQKDIELAAANPVSVSQNQIASASFFSGIEKNVGFPSWMSRVRIPSPALSASNVEFPICPIHFTGRSVISHIVHSYLNVSPGRPLSFSIGLWVSVKQGLVRWHFVHKEMTLRSRPTPVFIFCATLRMTDV